MARVLHINLQIREELHEAMKAIRRYRRQIQGSDTKLCQVFEEAIRKFLAEPEQQEVLAQAHREQQVLLEKVQRNRPKSVPRKSAERMAS